MSVVIHGEAQLQARLMALQRVGKPIMGIVGQRAVREQKLLVPRKTGNLRRTIHLASATAREARTEASASYAAAVEFGTRPHVIRAKNGKALRFANGRGGAQVTLAGRVRSSSVRKLGSGAYVFRSAVHHPGTRAQPFMVPGARKAIDAAGLRDIVVKAWNEAA